MINPHHWKEWIEGSGISPEITALNLQSLDGTMGENSPLYKLLDPSDSKHFQKNGTPRASTSRRYSHVDQGGWWCQGSEGSQWGCFKPDNPRTTIKGIKFDGYSFNGQLSISPLLASEIKKAYPDQERITIKISDTRLGSVYQNELFKSFQQAYKGFFNEVSFKLKPLKYEHPAGVETELFLLKLPEKLIHRIISKFTPFLESEYLDSSDSMTFGAWLNSHNINFWTWLENHPEIPITITEGGKKAGSLLTQGYIAIALSGIWNGQTTERDFMGQVVNRSLKAQLERLATKGREFIFCFDHDTNPTTILHVRKAIKITGKLLQYKGCKVSVMSWLYPEKGIDDLIVKRGKKVLDEIYQKRKPLDLTLIENELSLEKYNPLKVDLSKLTNQINNDYTNVDFKIPEACQIVGLKSPKNTGKTEYLSNIANQNTWNGKKVLVITHRIQLGRALCDRFGVDYIDGWRKSKQKILGMGLCIDSLHPSSQARFNPQDWEGASVFIDEVDQVLWHLFNSDTCRSKRVAILKTLRELLKTVIATGGKIYLSDADLSSISIDYIKSISDYSQQPFIIENTYQRTVKRLLYNYGGSSPAALYEKLKEAIEQGQKVIIHVSGQKSNSTWGTQVLKRNLQNLFPNKKILRIDAESVADRNHPAYKVMSQLNEVLPRYNIVIASPTIETGVSIDVDHFDSVWCIAWGVQSVDSVCQTLERVRSDVPRHLWINKTALPSLKVGNGATNIGELFASTNKQFKATFALLQKVGVNDLTFEQNENPLSEELTAWARRAVSINYGFYNYREAIIRKLLEEGYQFEPTELLPDGEAKEVNKGLTDVKQVVYNEHCQKVAIAQEITPNEAEDLERKQSLTESERLSLLKQKIKQRYGCEVTPDLVEQDDDGLNSKLRLQYYLTLGKEHLPARDEASIKSLRNGHRELFKPDVNKSTLALKVAVFEQFGILDFLNFDREYSSSDLTGWYGSVIPFKRDINTILGFKIDRHPVKALNQFLNKLGYQLEQSSRKNGVRFYSLANGFRSINRDEIFDYWLSKEQSEQEYKEFANDLNSVPTDPNNMYTESVGTENHKLPPETTEDFKEGDKVLYRGSFKMIESISDGLATLKDGLKASLCYLKKWNPFDKYHRYLDRMTT